MKKILKILIIYLNWEKGSYGEGILDFVMKHKLFQKTKTQIEIVRRWEQSEKFFAPGVLIRIKNGKGDLYTAFSDISRKETFYNLMFQNKTLFQLQGEEYFCPTCEKIVRTGYNLEQTEVFSMKRINQSGLTFDEVLEELQPLLGLLLDGHYCIWDTKLYPTDGNGNLFWDFPNDEKVKDGSCPYYRGDGEYGGCYPHFTIATQSSRKMNPERVEYYRKHSDCRAIAYYIDGNLTALLDGHHKAMAAALDHRKCNAVVISPCYLGHEFIETQRKMFLYVNDTRFDLDEIAEREAGEIEKTAQHPKKSAYGVLAGAEEKISFQMDTKALAQFYPTVADCAAIDCFEPITDSLIDDFLMKKKRYEVDDMCTFLEALGGLKHKRRFEVLDFTLHTDWYMQKEILLGAIDQLAKLPRTEALEDYLVKYMTEIEDEFPSVGEAILDIL